VRILVNGAEGATVAALDRGLQYGDGLFETIAVRRGRPRLLPLHFDRLDAGCSLLGIPRPDRSVLESEVVSVTGSDDAVVKVIVTRGCSARGYRAPDTPEPTRVVAAFPPPAHPVEWRSQGVRVRTCRTPVATSPALAGVKHLGRLEHVLARSEWREASIAEGLMLDTEGRVVCGTQSNVFAVLGGELRTPRLDRGGVAGVMRRAVLQWASGRCIVAREAELWPDDLRGAEEVFLTNALIGAWPVAALDGRSLARGHLATEFLAWLEAG
jgi:4-amino-4-deoxychorismate lyase